VAVGVKAASLSGSGESSLAPALGLRRILEGA
jgi:hypothetical protein